MSTVVQKQELMSNQCLEVVNNNNNKKKAYLTFDIKLDAKGNNYE